MWRKLLHKFSYFFRAREGDRVPEEITDLPERKENGESLERIWNTLLERPESLEMMGRLVRQASRVLMEAWALVSLLLTVN